MGNLLEYSGIITKLRAMEARLLTDEQFEEIAALTSVTFVLSGCAPGYERGNAAQRKYRKSTDSLAVPRLHKDLLFLRSETEKVFKTLFKAV